MTRNRRLRRALLEMRRRLSAMHETHGFMPYVWLVNLAFLFFQFFFTEASILVWIITLTSIVFFLPIYFFAFGRTGRALNPYIGGLLGLGMAVLPWNGGASVYFIYASSFCAWVGAPALAVRYLALVLLLAVLETLILDLHPSSMVVVMIVGTMVGVGNIVWSQLEDKNEALRQSQSEVRRLAVSSERERIARDLHDLLGHTLSTVTLKAELAGKLIVRDVGKARQEIAEVERISRDALHQVRAAVAGYRGGNIRSELASGKLALETSGIALRYTLQGFELEQDLENALALVLREGLTNVLRHSKAEQCDVSLSTDRRFVRLVLADDGCGVCANEGAGINGMRERLAVHDGTLSLSARDTGGLRLLAQVPLKDNPDDPVA